MGKVVATYNVKVTLREPDDLEEGKSVDPLTIEEIELTVAAAVAENASGNGVLAEATATAERTDI